MRSRINGAKRMATRSDIIGWAFALSPILIWVLGYPYGLFAFFVIIIAFIVWHIVDENAVWRQLLRP